MTATTLTRLAQYTDAQMKKYSPVREYTRRFLADQCRDEGYSENVIRVAYDGGTAALEHHGVTEAHGAAAETN